ncbi:MAG: PKD domain-containing protein [Candidatus Zixiibacteriota bacterium]
MDQLVKRGWGHPSLYLLFACLLSFCLVLAPVSSAQNLDNKGTEFILTFLPNLGGSGEKVELHLTSDVPTDVTIQYPMNAPIFDTTVAVSPGSVTIVALPLAAQKAWIANLVQDNAVHLFAADEFVAYMINLRSATSDAALGLPVDVMNIDYIVATYIGASHGSDWPQFTVLAENDGTDVTITPANNLVGHAAGVPFTVTLNRGEAYFARSQTRVGAASDLTGTIVESTLRVALTNGNQCTNIPPDFTACDHVFEVAQPTQTWGKEVFVTNLPHRSGSIYRILASSDNTTVLQDGSLLGTINRGEFLETSQLSGRHVFSADSAIFVVQFMPGQNAPGSDPTGDPAMGNLAPSEQYMSNYTFSTVGGSQFAEHFLTITAYNGDLATIMLDGVPIGASTFVAIPGTNYSSANIPLTEGTHTTSSDSTHGITVEGFNDYDSYLYPGGALFVSINPPETDPPICDLTIDGCEAFGSAIDTGFEASGIYFVTLDPGSQNLQLAVDPFIAGDSSVTYMVSTIDEGLPGSGVVRVTDGAGNSCTSPVDLDCSSLLVPIVVCTGDTASFIGCLDGNGEFPWCVDLSISGATSVDVSPAGPVWANNQLCGVATQSGQITYTVTASNQNGSTTCDVSVSFDLLDVPTAGFDLSPATGPAPLNVTFTDLSSGDGIVYEWQFGDGGTSADPNPSHTYTSPGVYDVTLVVSNGCGSDTATIIEAVEVLPAGEGPIPTPEWINVFCSQPTLNGIALAPGDVITAYDPDGVLCGMDVVRDNGKFGFMAVYRDDFYSDLDEGADPGDLISFRINGEAVQTLSEIIWTTNGDSFELCRFKTETCKVIHLQEGWNLISWNVTYSDDIEVAISEIVNCIDIVLGFNGDALTYDPDLPLFSTLDSVDFYHGYWFKMSCPVDLELCGDPIGLDGVIRVTAGWNLVSYWPNAPMAVEDGFISILDNLEVALGFENEALVWVPGGLDFNTLHELKPCLGYWVKLSVDDMLFYSMGLSGSRIEPPARQAGLGDQVYSPRSRSWISVYGANMTLDGVPLAENAVIEAFTSDGTPSGRGIYSNGMLKFTPIYGFDSDDEQTENYPKPGDRVSVYVNGVQTWPEIVWSENGDRVALSAMSTNSDPENILLPGVYTLNQNYPNPFNPSTVISFNLPKAGTVELAVFNLLGQKIKTLAGGFMEAGEHEVAWDATSDDGSTVSTGIYFYRLQADGFVQTRKMVLMK